MELTKEQAIERIRQDIRDCYSDIAKKQQRLAFVKSRQDTYKYIDHEYGRLISSITVEIPLLIKRYELVLSAILNHREGESPY